jgi:hypothetical protein
LLGKVVGAELIGRISPQSPPPVQQNLKITCLI